MAAPQTAPLDDTPYTPTSAEADALAKIKAIVGLKGYVETAADMEPNVVDWRGLYRGRALLVVKPASTEEVSQVMAAANAVSLPVVPQSGNTSLCGASVPMPDGRAIVLSVARMNSVRAIDPDNYTMTVEAGCILQTLQETASAADRYFPLSLAAEGSCMIGGNLSTNAGGTNVLKYGNARDLVLGLEVVLPDGRIWNGLRGLRKDNTGYDLKHLFLGAEGTLGVITAAVLKLFPKPRAVETAYCAVRDVAAAKELLGRAKAESGDGVETFELIPRLVMELVLKHIPGTADPLETRYEMYVLLELVSTATDTSGLRDTMEALLGAAMEDGLVLDAAIAQNEQQRKDLWRLREEAAESQKLEGPSIKHDISVPVATIDQFYTEAEAAVHAVDPGVRVVGFGHLGDGNLHYNLQMPEGSDGKAFLAQWGAYNRLVHDLVDRYGGSISAEHGIGQLKRDELAHYKDPVALDVMRTVKSALDPNGIMNPGKVL